MTKYRIYIDEVGNPDLKSSENQDHRYLCLTGVIFDLNYIAEKVHPELEELKRRYFFSHPDEPVIFHRKEILYKQYDFTALKDPEVEKAFNAELLGLFKAWDYKVITVVIDKLEQDLRYSTWKYDPYHYCQEVMLERYRLFLDIRNAKGDVMIESRGGAEDRRLKRSFRTLMEKGTNNLTASDLQKHLTSLELKVRSKEANITGLQIADLMAHPARRYVFKSVFNLEDGKITFADKIIEILVENKFFRYNGKIYGYGVKKLP